MSFKAIKLEAFARVSILRLVPVKQQALFQESLQMKNFRDVEKIILGQATSDGAGVKLTRLLTQDLQKRLDPYLMLDAFGSEAASDYIAGFPDHPHRGFETVTYMLEGKMRHHDSAGNSGLLQDGGVQWMTAGKGVIHSEMPEQDKGRMSGFQLWLNLPSKDKMCPPSYQDIQSEYIPETTLANGVKIRIIAGESHGVKGAVQKADTNPKYLDIHFPHLEDPYFEEIIPKDHNSFLYVYAGEVRIHGTNTVKTVHIKEMAILSNNADHLKISAHPNSKLILISGQPLNESIVQYGPFVMNTKEQIIQAVDDYRAGRLA
jgi:redox-sensitive bicupin YhaK (pirin superfamily)